MLLKELLEVLWIQHDITGRLGKEDKSIHSLQFLLVLGKPLSYGYLDAPMLRKAAGEQLAIKLVHVRSIGMIQVAGNDQDPGPGGRLGDQRGTCHHQQGFCSKNHPKDPLVPKHLFSPIAG